ncbi:Uncharacterised protein [Streptococcus mitis]|uniref:Uncharacterized protein n=1 Tax=Streptococcus mitis TaxID=28037 RepID=A0A4U9ZZD7_STRMT|nr:hypothetical protein [Streptococcus mitis]VTS45474.1 Uncharacterised protein [Streptococcus mitis]
MAHKNETHIDIFNNRYEFYPKSSTKITFKQGKQSKEARLRFKEISDTLKADYLKNRLSRINLENFSKLEDSEKNALTQLVDGITSEVGRALVGLTFLQLTIKSIKPIQNIRLHKGNNRKDSFSWEEGISMRTLDKNFTTPFLREMGFLNLNRDGVFMTRSLSENYPYTPLYKAQMKGPFKEWITIVNFIEEKPEKSSVALDYLMSLLSNRSVKYNELVEKTCQLAENFKDRTFEDYKEFLEKFFNQTNYSARAFEVVLHALYQVLDSNNFLSDLDLKPMTQMRSANKKHGNVGDIELAENEEIIEAWDAKFGKPYLRDELEELNDKLNENNSVKIAGFVSNVELELRDVESRRSEIEFNSDTKIYLYTFEEWVQYVIKDPLEELPRIGYEWVNAVVETFSRKRIGIAPIDEPCLDWLEDLAKRLEEAS